MRLRHKPYAMDRINEYSHIVIGNPEESAGNWKEIFGNEKPIHIEVGTGRGTSCMIWQKQIRILTILELKNSQVLL